MMQYNQINISRTLYKVVENGSKKSPNLMSEKPLGKTDSEFGTFQQQLHQHFFSYCHNIP